MADAIRPRGTEISVTTANTVGGANVVRIYAASLSLVTVKDSTTATISTFTIPAGQVEYLKKNPTDTIAGSTALLCVWASY